MPNIVCKIAESLKNYRSLSFYQPSSNHVLNQLLCLIILLFQFSTFAQEKTQELGSFQRNYSLYKIISHENDTTDVSTVLNIHEYNKLNFRRKDDFELLPFHNQGQTFNKLGVDFGVQSIFPQMGFRAKHYDYQHSSDVNYYKVATPTSELMYRTGMEEGQVLDAFVTLNTSERFNLFLGYKGLQSQGKYRHSEATNTNFTTSFNFHTLNNGYRIRGHFSSYSYENEENGGLTPTSLERFETADDDFFERSRLDVNFQDAENKLDGKRTFFDHQLSLNKLLNFNEKKNDSTQIIQAKNELALGHIFEYETKHYRFNKTAESNATSLYGDVLNSSINDHTHFRKLENRLYLNSKQEKLGKLKASVGLTSYNYRYNDEVNVNGNAIPEKLQGDNLDVKGSWEITWKDLLRLNVNAGRLFDGNHFEGSELRVSGKVNTHKLDHLEFFATWLDHSPNVNLLLHQSDYEIFNWSNNFSNERKTLLGAKLTKKELGSLQATFSSVENYTYFNESLNPAQADKTLKYLKIKYNLPVNYKKFTLESDFLYQHVFDQGDAFFRVPDFIMRSSIFFSDHIFEGDPMFLQTGFTAKYFTNFYANAYNPVVSEFYLQNTDEIGNYVLLDFFANAKVQEARLFLKVENILTPLMSKREYFAAPLYPYRDLIIRFGLTWNFFM